MPTHWELIGRIALGGVLGALIGFERNLHSRHVVLRTHIVVAMASASFMVVSAFFAFYQGYEGKGVEVDGSRIAASVVSGIGFLAGGVILKSGASVQGLTTASSLWLATAVGLLAGAGMPWEGFAVAFMGVASLSFLRRFEEKKETFVHRKVSVVMGEEPEGMPGILEAVSTMGVRVSGFDYERLLDDRKVIVKFEAHIPTDVGVDQFIRRVETHEGVRQVRIKLPG